jgi:transcription-repair coupling factor (superfamily II helicase)
MKTMKYERNGLLDMLHAGHTCVTFTKVDGTERVMECTLRGDLIPASPVDPDKPKRVVKENLDVVRVFDTEKQEWRSFRIDSVVSVTSVE